MHSHVESSKEDGGSFATDDMIEKRQVGDSTEDAATISKNKARYHATWLFVVFVLVSNCLFVGLISLVEEPTPRNATETSDEATNPATRRTGVCSSAEEVDQTNTWLWSAPNFWHPSCSSPNNGVNDMGSRPTMCDGDPTSVRLEARPNFAECLAAKAPQCEIPMHNFTSLDYDMFVQNDCRGLWTAPLWISPNTWVMPPNNSGEIDSTESCLRNRWQMNFASGGHQVAFGDLDDMIETSVHITVRKDEDGIVTISHCDATYDREAQCPPPVYENCEQCENEANGYACWCNDDTNPPHIYGSGGCTADGADCMWTMLSDIWNGVWGDAGYAYCMGAVPEIDLNAGQPNLNSECVISVERVLIRGEAENGVLNFSPASPAECAGFTVG